MGTSTLPTPSTRMVIVLIRRPATYFVDGLGRDGLLTGGTPAAARGDSTRIPSRAAANASPRPGQHVNAMMMNCSAAGAGFFGARARAAESEVKFNSNQLKSTEVQLKSEVKNRLSLMASGVRGRTFLCGRNVLPFRK